MLKNCMLFQGLESSYIKHLIESVYTFTKKYVKGNIILSPFECGKQIGIIMEGKVTVYKSLSSGNDIIINTLSNNEIFGLTSISNNQKNFPTFITANSKCRVLFIPKESLFELLKIDPIVLNNFIECITSRLQHLIKKIELLAIPNVKERVLCYLLQHSSQRSSFKVNKSKLLSQLSISHASLYRSLVQLEDENLIKRNLDGSISLTN